MPKPHLVEPQALELGTATSADQNELRWTTQQAERLLPPDGRGWTLVRAQPLVLPTPNGQIGIVAWCLWSRPKDTPNERH